MIKNRQQENSGKILTRRDFIRLASLSAAGLAVGCAIDPVTGKRVMMLVSEEQEIAIDRQHSPQQFSSDYGVSQDRSLNNYLSRVGRKMTPLTHRPRMPYNFQVVNATYVNAYAFPGGTIAATRGILLKMNDEAELASLLGHELGHVNARHTAEQMSKGQVTSLVLAGAQLAVGSDYADLAGQIGQIGAGMMLASYSRDNEREADALGNRYMTQAGYSTNGFVGLMEMLNTMSKHKPGYAELLFSTHPMSDERYQTAVKDARTTYQATRKNPVNRERYMDNIKSLRSIKGAIELMQKGDAAMGKKKYGQAESLYRQALKKAPNDYAGLTMLSKSLIAQNKSREAERYAERAKKVYPREAQAHHLSGFAKLKRNKFSSAYRDFSQCDRLLPGNPSITFFKGISLEGMGKRRESAGQYQKYLGSVKQGSQAQHAYKRLVEWGYIKQQ